ncbi:MAG: sarcosine oxidase subunit gamma [Pseudomonadota bacterium]
MADMAFDFVRQPPLTGRVHASSGVALTVARDACRMSLRARDTAVPALNEKLGLELPRRPKSSATSGSRTALWLGPDEWLVFDERSDPITDLVCTQGLFSAVDISHRNTAIMITGPQASDVLNAGCPQDLSLAAFPAGACSRTVFGKAEVVLFRVKPTVFRLEVWRSFSTYAFDYLTDAAKSL